VIDPYVRQESYGFWLLASLVPAGILGVLNAAVVEALAVAVVVSTVAYVLFNYPF